MKLSLKNSLKSKILSKAKLGASAKSEEVKVADKKETKKPKK